MAYKVMAYVVMAYIVEADIGMVYIVMALARETSESSQDTKSTCECTSA